MYTSTDLGSSYYVNSCFRHHLIAFGLTCSAGSVPAEWTSNLLSNDCRNPWAIWLRQLFLYKNQYFHDIIQ